LRRGIIERIFARAKGSVTVLREDEIRQLLDAPAE